MVKNNRIDKIYKGLLSSKIKEQSERVILTIAILSYLLHLLLIVLVNQGFITLESKFFQNPIAAIYTPFTFILVYEVYLLIFFLPKLKCGLFFQSGMSRL